MTRNFFSALSLGLALCAASAASAATNLLVNPSNEAALVNGEIPGWSEATGSNWTQRSGAPTPQDGLYTFFPGIAAQAVLRQVVDVSSFATAIDAGTQSFTFSGYRQSFAQNPTDTSEFQLLFQDGTANVLAQILSGQSATTTTWDFYSTTLLAPVGTRSISVDLIAIRNAGTNNDGNFDNLSLTAAAPVPLPASALLLGGALGLAGVWGRRRKAS